MIMMRTINADRGDGRLIGLHPCAGVNSYYLPQQPAYEFSPYFDTNVWNLRTTAYNASP